MDTQSRSSIIALCLSAIALAGLAACDVDDPITLEDDGLYDSEGEPLEPVAPDGEAPEFAEPKEGEEYRGVSERAADALALEIDPAGFTFLDWHSDETIGASQCPPGQVVTGFECAGPYCDEVRLECHAYPNTWMIGLGFWSDWFEYDGKDSHVCPVGSKITGIDCWGSNCDNIAIECTMAAGLATARCAWSAWYSDEDPSPFYATNGDAIQGIWCSGPYCDDKRFLVCET